MQKSQASLTSLITAYGRLYHTMHHTPLIFADEPVYQLFTANEQQSLAQNLSQLLTFLDPALAASCKSSEEALSYAIQKTMGITISRSRYAEDHLRYGVKQGICQYIILGAGLDTFAFRCSELSAKLEIFEVDHPITQDDKIQRILKAGWEIPSNLSFVPVDFLTDDLGAVLSASKYNPNKPAFFSWLGVTLYLPCHIVFKTLKSIASLAPSGSSIVFDYIDTAAFSPGATGTAQLMQTLVQNVGEPLEAGLNPATLLTDLQEIGLTLKENISPEIIEKHYFSGRADSYHADPNMHYALVVVN